MVSDGSDLPVLHLLAPAPFGGLESVVTALAAGAAGRGRPTYVCAILGRSEETPRVLADLARRGVDLREVREGERAYLRERGAIRRLLDEIGPAVLHSHGYRADVVGRWSARGRQAPTVSTVHGFTGGDLKNRLYERVQRRSLRRFDAVVAVSRPLRDELRDSGVAPDRLHTIPNAWAPAGDFADALSARTELGAPESTFHVGWVGRLSVEKDPGTFVEALGRLEGPVHATVLGDGPLLEDVRARGRDFQTGTTLHAPGPLPDARKLFRAFDAVVLSSRTEGTPIVLLEAMAAGAPVVATRVGGVPDVVGDDEALLVPAEDPDALAEALARVRRRPEEAAARAVRASARLARDFALEPWLDRYDRLYASLATVPRSEVPA